MAEFKISEYVDRDGVVRDTQFMLDQIGSLEKAFTKLDSMVVSFPKVKGPKELATVTKEVTKAQDELQTSTQQLITSQKDLDKAAIEARLNKQRSNKELKTEVELQTAVSGSIDKARAAIKALTLERNKLNLETAEGVRRQQELNAQIDKNNAFIEKNGDAYLKQKLNIGNYAGSAKIIVEALGEVEKKIDALKTKQAGLQNLSQSNPVGFKLGNQANELNQVNAQLAEATEQFTALQNVTSNPKFLNLASNFGDARTEVRGFTSTLIELEQKGLGSSDFANELRKRLASLTDEIADTRQEIKALSSDTRQFDLVSSGLNTLASSYEAYVGIAELAGQTDEDTQKSIQKLVAVQSIANGVREIANQITERGTLANKALTFVQGLYTTATNASTAATVRLAAAMKLIGIGLIIGAVAALVVNYDRLFKSTSEAANKRKLLNDLEREAAENYGKEKVQLDQLVSSLKREGISRQEKQTIIEDLQSKYPGYFDNLTTEADLNVKLSEAYAKASQGILLKARAQAASDRLAKNETELLTKELDLSEGIARINENLAKQLQIAGPEGAKLAKKVAAQMRKQKAEDFALETADLEKQNGYIISLITKSNDEIAKLGGTSKAKTKENEKKEAKPKVEKDDTLQRELQAEFELLKLQQERRIALNEAVVVNDEIAYKERLLALTQFSIEKNKLIDLEYAYEKNSKKRTAQELELLNRQTEEKRFQVAEDVSGKAAQIHKDYVDSVKKNNGDLVANYSATYKALSGALDKFAADQKERQELEKEANANILSSRTRLAEELKGLVFDLFTGSIERDQNALQDQIDMLDIRKAKELEVIRQTAGNAREAAAQTAVVEARANSQREAFERKKRQLQVEAARFERIKALTEVAQQTAIGIISAQKYPPPLNVILSGLIAGIGIAQTARILASPIPKFFKGKDKNNRYEGPGIVGDGGRSELIMREDGSMEVTPDYPVYTYIKSKDVILPDAKKFFEGASMEQMGKILARPVGTNATDMAPVVAGINKGLKSLENTVKNKREVHFKQPDAIKTWIHTDMSIEVFKTKYPWFF